MSSARFEIRLKPDPRLRRLVAVSASLSVVAGATMLMHLPLAPPFRALLTLVWVVAALAELAGWARSAARVRGLGIDAEGRCFVLDRAGRRVECDIMSGSAMGDRLAWLRLGFGDGRRHGELLGGGPDEVDWRRLRLHLGPSSRSRD